MRAFTRCYRCWDFLQNGKRALLHIGSVYSKMSMKFVKKIKIIKIFWSIRDLHSKKQGKPNLIWSEEKNDIKDKFLNSAADQKKADDSPWTRTSTKRETQTEVKLKTTHHPHWLSSSPLWRKWLTRKSWNTPLLSAPLTSDWPCAHKSNNPTTIKHRKFSLLFNSISTRF